MHIKKAKQIWDELNERYAVDERIRSIKLLTIKREFEMLRMMGMSLSRSTLQSCPIW